MLMGKFWISLDGFEDLGDKDHVDLHDLRAWELRVIGASAIRIAQNGFWLWQLDDQTVARLRNAKAYWERQVNMNAARDVMDIIELKTKTQYLIPVPVFLNEKVSLSNLKVFKVLLVNPLLPTATRRHS